MIQHGFVRVAAVAPPLRVADPKGNAQRMLPWLERAEQDQTHLVVFPELSLSGYTSADLFHQNTLIEACRAALESLIREANERYSGLVVVGLPWLVEDQLFNVAAVFQKGRLLGVVPKSYLPNYKEFYEDRWFAPAHRARTKAVHFNGLAVPFGTDLLFDAEAQVPGFVVGVEICEDIWVPIPPSSFQALAGAKVLVNLSASNEVLGKAGYRRQLVANQSGRCVAGYVFSACGPTESSTDLVFGGHLILAENGSVLAESPRFERDGAWVCQDLDVQRLQNDRLKMPSFGEACSLLGERTFRRIPFRVDHAPQRLLRSIDAHPFVPRGEESLAERCQEIFHTQVAGLGQRLNHLGRPSVTIGVSGGLDSTLALLVACKTMDLLRIPRATIQGFTMPGFGTTKRTWSNALALMQHLGVTARQIDIRGLCFEEMRALGHRPFGISLDELDVESFATKLGEVPVENQHDLIFENIQARMRTSLLMNQGFVIGTGDLSELALGWCTYNGDHISMYNPNVSIPKTLVKFLVRWAALNEFEAGPRATLLDIVGTKISPELLPAGKDGTITQSTESVVGPYELHDFFLFHFLRYGASPAKILFLAEHAEFEQTYPPEAVRSWLRVFLRRFFANQFKRSCLPDGPKVGTISLSPRGDWRMPSDAVADAWLKDVED